MTRTMTDVSYGNYVLVHVRTSANANARRTRCVSEKAAAAATARGKAAKGAEAPKDRPRWHVKTSKNINVKWKFTVIGCTPLYEMHALALVTMMTALKQRKAATTTKRPENNKLELELAKNKKKIPM